jgi:deoxyadenosine/deoxycytidine kinase
MVFAQPISHVIPSIVKLAVSTFSVDYIKTQTDLNVLIIDVSDLDFVKKQEDYVFLLEKIHEKIN